MKVSIRLIGFRLLALYAMLPTAFADGIYDGVWLGTETATVPGIGTESEQTWTIIYQGGPDTLYAARQDFDNLDEATAMRLVRRGSNWILPAPITETVSARATRARAVGSSGSSPSTVRSPGIVIVPIWSAIVTATIQLRMRLVIGLEVMRRAG